MTAPTTAAFSAANFYLSSASGFFGLAFFVYFRLFLPWMLRCACLYGFLRIGLGMLAYGLCIPRDSGRYFPLGTVYSL
jgi:hypothetical protein